MFVTIVQSWGNVERNHRREILDLNYDRIVPEVLNDKVIEGLNMVLSFTVTVMHMHCCVCYMISLIFAI